MKKLLLVGLFLLLFATQAQAWTCYWNNNYNGGVFYWTHPIKAVAYNSARNVCQANTPVGYGCFFQYCNF